MKKIIDVDDEQFRELVGDTLRDALKRVTGPGAARAFDAIEAMDPREWLQVTRRAVTIMRDEGYRLVREAEDNDAVTT